MSIRAFHLEEFLVLCRTNGIRDQMVDRGQASAGGILLSLKPWLWQAQAIGIAMPYVVQLALVGVPANAWTRRAAQELLRGIGLVVRVAESTARRNDMPRFQVWLCTDDPARIPPRCIMVVEEPRRRQALGQVEGADALSYPVEIIIEAPPSRPSSGSAPSQPPPPPPPPADEGDGGRIREGGPRQGGCRGNAARGKSSGGQ
ncbi:hypothetical protein VPH35_096644 [Triticum aestivum]|uniref:DUF4283 domain-containing protein n=1 Tax=Aegilops tauschii subsp. strangulata TaxID=200361 RepID=A0A453K480_AEGTS